MMNSIKTKVITGILAATMAASTFTALSTTVFADELLFEEEFDESEIIDEYCSQDCSQDNDLFEAEDVFSDDDFITAEPVDADIIIDDGENVIMEDTAFMAADPAAKAGSQNTYTPPESYIPSGNAMFYKRDGEYYMYSPDLGGEMTVMDYTLIIKEIYDAFGVEVAIEFAESIDGNPHDEEILRVFGPWEIMDHWERRIDEKTNRWEI